jgi:hypothetical protein
MSEKSFEYLKNMSWNDITRDERFFCQELFSAIRGNERKFVEFLCEHSTKLTITSKEGQWDSGYEVCFYRDLKFHFNLKKNMKWYSPKRTFDLCLFGEKDIIVIEAKAEQGFDNKQIKVFQQDRDRIENAISAITPPVSNPKVHLVALCSSYYNPKDDTLKDFDCKITWKDVAGFIPEKKKVFERADSLYPHKEDDSAPGNTQQ